MTFDAVSPNGTVAATIATSGAKTASGIARNLFEAPNSIIYPSEDLADADELARLKGLILWLAWDSGIRVTLKKPYQESSEERDERVRTNALMVALAQVIKGDKVVEEEAKASIGPMSSSEMDWLNWVLATGETLHGMVIDPGLMIGAKSAGLGGIALVPSKPDLGVRVILREDATKTSLVYFAASKDHIAYQTKVIKTAPFEMLMI
ncbi:hypothetical protein Geob_2864 [Geotalea daltonii FRC-32]|uniref:Uncharacterized protein n=1 Tax=Geotalea daltonii (strain DSM 22248 / JCM 15807 / FRC-32) TaxID=316067 RepID=B9M290_GEODF|nr:hypothetical protein [Geotalea daltonii]ACM21208.1 hypothetical protein Geob_2864 [Geotalea daltonii FRC-32]